MWSHRNAAYSAVGNSYMYEMLFHYDEKKTVRPGPPAWHQRLPGMRLYLASCNCFILCFFLKPILRLLFQKQYIYHWCLFVMWLRWFSRDICRDFIYSGRWFSFIHKLWYMYLQWSVINPIKPVFFFFVVRSPPSIFSVFFTQFSWNFVGMFGLTQSIEWSYENFHRSLLVRYTHLWVIFPHLKKKQFLGCFFKNNTFIIGVFLLCDSDDLAETSFIVDGDSVLFINCDTCTYNEVLLTLSSLGFFRSQISPPIFSVFFTQFSWNFVGM